MLSVSHPIIQRAAFAYQHVVEENKNDMVQKPHLLVEKEQHNAHWNHYVYALNGEARNELYLQTNDTKFGSCVNPLTPNSRETRYHFQHSHDSTWCCLPFSHISFHSTEVYSRGDNGPNKHASTKFTWWCFQKDADVATLSTKQVLGWWSRGFYS